MARALKGKVDREQFLVQAHGMGLTRANEVFAIAIDTAKNVYPDDDEAQFSYLAGFAQEVRRIAARAQNKGFRK
jgi:hypothetical protein